MKSAWALLSLTSSFSKPWKRDFDFEFGPEPRWWYTNQYVPVPPELKAAEGRSPAGTVVATLREGLPYVVRANVTELAVNKALNGKHHQLPNPHIVATTFDITYTGSTSPLNATHVEVEINGYSYVLSSFNTVAYNYDFPRSVLDAYDPKSPGDCTKPLGGACVSALWQHGISNVSTDGLKISAPECEDTLGGLNKKLSDEGFVLADVKSDVNPTYANSPKYPSNINHPFLWRASAAFTGRDQDALDEELGKMQLVGITANLIYINETGSSSHMPLTSVLCFRVDVNAPTGDGLRLAPSIAITISCVMCAAIYVIL